MSNENSVFACRCCSDITQYKMDKRNAYRHIKESLGLTIDSPELERKFLKELNII
jgi:hypothetical protein